jgi:hypothetical protein
VKRSFYARSLRRAYFKLSLPVSDGHFLMSESKELSPWSQYDWEGLAVGGVYVLVMLLRDAVLIIVLMGISHGVERVLDFIDADWHLIVYGRTITAAKIVSHGDHGLLLVFIVILAYKVIWTLLRE